jgi:hypothetical protein
LRWNWKDRYLIQKFCFRFHVNSSERLPIKNPSMIFPSREQVRIFLVTPKQIWPFVLVHSKEQGEIPETETSVQFYAPISLRKE